MTVHTLTQRHRAQQLLLRQATISQVAKLWPTLAWDQLDETFPGFAVLVARVVEQNRLTSAGLAAGYLRSFRRSRGLPGDAPSVVAEALNVDQFTTSLRITSLVAAKTAASNGVAAEVAMRNALTQTTGSTARLVLNAGRETVVETVKADPEARGYQRVLGGSGCDFCQMLAGRGAVYGADSADFPAHDKCGCTAEPVYA